MDVKPLTKQEKELVINMARAAVLSAVREICIRHGYEPETIERNKITELVYVALAEYLHV